VIVRGSPGVNQTDNQPEFYDYGKTSVDTNAEDEKKIPAPSLPDPTFFTTEELRQGYNSIFNV